MPQRHILFWTRKIRNEEQRQTLNEAKILARNGSLVAPGSNYALQVRRFEYQCELALIHKVHGHRHQYAQTRYKELSGWAAPAAGGPKASELSPAQRDADNLARLEISQELGHERAQITAIYCGV
jgi:hypothetical protein